MTFTALVQNGQMKLSPYEGAKFRMFMKENEGARLTIAPVLPESNKLRRYLEGAVIPLVAFYQEGMDHRNGEDCRRVREWLKAEFNGEMVSIAGKVRLVAKTTKGRESLNPFVDRVIEWLVENYRPPMEALDPEKYKYWKDTLYPYGGPPNYIDYLVETRLLREVDEERRTLTPVVREKEYR